MVWRLKCSAYTVTVTSTVLVLPMAADQSARMFRLVPVSERKLPEPITVPEGMVAAGAGAESPGLFCAGADAPGTTGIRSWAGSMAGSAPLMGVGVGVGVGVAAGAGAAVGAAVATGRAVAAGAAVAGG